MIILFFLIDYYLSYYLSGSFNLCFTTIYIINRLYFKDDLRVLGYVFILELFFNDKIFLYTIIVYLIYLFINFIKYYFRRDYFTYLIVTGSSIILNSLLESFLVMIIGYSLNIFYILNNLLLKIVCGLLISIFIKISNKLTFFKIK